ncbi:hypothetical protein J7T55_014611 [Diaporthe amygdali]|uniref:uncharacterized protein n=1 Tax=Phomopsis amygdali TaxID=1214568 RepID=UPI0022FDCED5|nr:uncharacterized protein J7T55_014611 [Diaporthe amygdali]KAJ0118158.1 hypothetical protein J7T55_014611 [Diaporthe amygdali]
MRKALSHIKHVFMYGKLMRATNATPILVLVLVSVPGHDAVLTLPPLHGIIPDELLAALPSAPRPPPSRPGLARLASPTPAEASQTRQDGRLFLNKSAVTWGAWGPCFISSCPLRLGNARTP